MSESHESRDSRAQMDAFKAAIRLLIDSFLAQHNQVTPLLALKFEDLLTGSVQMAVSQVPAELTADASGLQTIEEQLIPGMLREVNTDLRRITAISWISETWAVPVQNGEPHLPLEEAPEKHPTVLVTIETQEGCLMTSWMIETDPETGRRSLGEVRTEDTPVMMRFSRLFTQVFNKNQ
jgi:hypothetical protein